MITWERGLGVTIPDSVVVRGNGRIVFGEWVCVEDFVTLDCGDGNGSQIQVGDRSKIKTGGVLRTYGGGISVGTRVSLGEYIVIAGHGGVTIEDEVIIANHCSLNSTQHILNGTASIRFQGEVHKPIVVRRGAWIGAGVTILGGVEVGERTVVGAGSVVTRSLPAGRVCFGVPCRPMHKVFPDEVGEQ